MTYIDLGGGAYYYHRPSGQAYAHVIFFPILRHTCSHPTPHPKIYIRSRVALLDINVMARSRSFCFTWNNYPINHAEIIESLETRYHCYGYEEAPTTGTEHLQGFLYFAEKKSLAAVRRGLPAVHITIANGTVAQNIAYCSKDGQFLEFGDRPATQEEKGESEKERWAKARRLAISGEFEEIPDDIFMRCYSTIKKIHTDYMPPMPNEDRPCGIWIHGISGSGKTRSVHAAYPGLFQKPRTKWWDGYQNEEVVLVDDVDAFDVRLGGDFKHWADCYAFIAEKKGGAVRIRPKKLFVTSQYRIEEIWTDEQTRAALLRRFTIIEKILNQDIMI